MWTLDSDWRVRAKFGEIDARDYNVKHETTPFLIENCPPRQLLVWSLQSPGLTIIRLLLLYRTLFASSPFVMWRTCACRRFRFYLCHGRHSSIVLLTSCGVECAFPHPIDMVGSEHARRPGPTHQRVIRLALITDRGSPCDASTSAAAAAAAAAGMRKGAVSLQVAVPCRATTVMYRRWPAGLNPAPSFIVHLLSGNEPFGTRTIAITFVLYV